MIIVTYCGFEIKENGKLFIACTVIMSLRCVHVKGSSLVHFVELKANDCVFKRMQASLFKIYHVDGQLRGTF